MYGDKSDQMGRRDRSELATQSTQAADDARVLGRDADLTGQVAGDDAAEAAVGQTEQRERQPRLMTVGERQADQEQSGTERA